jgi:2'-5' RNA ligase
LTANELRLFVAVELGDGVRQALSDLQDNLRERGLERLRWVRGEGIHLTLKFLGDTQEEKVPQISEALSRAVAGTRRHRLSLGRIGTFGGKRPRVLWVDLVGDTVELASLQADVEKGLSGLGFEREKRRFSPHLTLARVRPETSADMAEAIAKAIESVRAPDTAVLVSELALIRSTLGPGGAVYNRLMSVQLPDGD